MTIDYDPIPVLEAAGYTEREAAFLYLAALHSGYFLRRQYLHFIERGRGALAAQFLRRAFALGHIQSIACGQARFVYHITSVEVYAATGLGASHHRRLKGDATIKSRLMVLDFILDHLDATLLDSEESKINYFVEAGFTESLLPRSHGAAFAEEFPILIKERPCFTFFDDGTLSSSSFEKFLSRYRALFVALPGFELLYLSDSTRNFERTRQLFSAKLADEQPAGMTTLTPRGVDHFLAYLRARERADSGESSLTLRDLARLRDGDSLYTHREFQAFLTAGSLSSVSVEQIRQRFKQQGERRKFTAAVLPHSYPLHHFKFEGQPKGKLGSSERSIQKPFVKRQAMQHQLFSKGGEEG